MFPLRAVRGTTLAQTRVDRDQARVKAAPDG